MYVQLLKLSSLFLKLSQLEAKKVVLARQGTRSFDQKQLLGPADIEDGSSTYQNKKNKDIAIALKHLDAKAVPSGDDGNAYLGSGAYGDVIEIVWKGKHAAMKLTTSDYDFEAYRSVAKLTNSLPNFAKRHLPQIYYQTEVTRPDSSKYAENKTLYITVMEYLHPLPPGIKLQGWGRTDHSTSSSFLAQIAKMVPLELNRIIRSKLSSATTATNFLNYAYQTESWQLFSVDTNSLSTRIIFRDLAESLHHALVETQHEFKDDKDVSALNIPEITQKITNKLQSELGHDVRNSKKHFPRNYDTDTPKQQDHIDPRLNKLHSALRWLNQKTGMEWQDLHANNIMYRPSTDDLVAVDVGMFEF